MTKQSHGTDAARSASGYPHSKQRDGAQHSRCADKDKRVLRGYSEEKTGEDMRKTERRNGADCDSGESEHHPLKDDHIPHILRLGAQCKPNAQTSADDQSIV